MVEEEWPVEGMWTKGRNDWCFNFPSLPLTSSDSYEKY